MKKQLNKNPTKNSLKAIHSDVNSNNEGYSGFSLFIFIYFNMASEFEVATGRRFVFDCCSISMWSKYLVCVYALN